MFTKTTQSAAVRYSQIRKQTEQICQPLATEDYVVQPITDVSPPKWHLGHTTWFFENFILREYAQDYKLYNPDFNFLFNSYYESQGPRTLRSNRGNMTRPVVEEIYKYRKYVDRHLTDLLEKSEHNPPDDKLLFLTEVGLQHEQQHQELLTTDLKYILGNNPLFPAYAKSTAGASDSAPSHSPAPHSQEWAAIEEGNYEIGYRGDAFCWDNEKSAHRVFVEDFEISTHLVTNGEYLEFIKAGGYDNHEHWLMEGWEWLNSLVVKAPLYWFKKTDGWYHYTLHGLQKIDRQQPLTHVSYYEADAYAHWKGHRLPTEFEWEIACRLHHDDIPSQSNFLESGIFHPQAPRQQSDMQLMGNVWEWTSSAYGPYPRYPRYKGALGEYNGKFMINQMVLRGGSVATPRSHIRPTYRNFFHPDKRWQFSGIRLIK